METPAKKVKTNMKNMVEICLAEVEEQVLAEVEQEKKAKKEQWEWDKQHNAATLQKLSNLPGCSWVQYGTLKEYLKYKAAAKMAFEDPEG